jgi:hypothetical protein
MASLALVLAIGWAIASVEDKAGFVPPDARNIRKDILPNGYQLSYVVTRKSPELGWSPIAMKKAEESGWRKCSGPRLGRWTVHMDRTGQQLKLIHRHVLMLAKSERTLILVGQYYSQAPAERGVPSSIPPDSDGQHVTVMELSGTEEDMEEARSTFSAMCPK